MPKRGKRPSRSEETELPGGVPPPAAPAAPGLSAPSAPSTRRKAEELMQRLWNGELAQSRETVMPACWGKDQDQCRVGHEEVITW